MRRSCLVFAPLLVLLCSLGSPAWGQSAEADQLQRALDELEVVEALISGKVTNATRTKALAEIESARLQIQAVQAALLKAHGAVDVATTTGGGATVTVTEGPGGGGATLQVQGQGASLSINMNVQTDEPGVPVHAEAPPLPPPPPPPVRPQPLEMAPAAFTSLKAAIQVESFADGKLRVLRDAMKTHKLTVAQAGEILPLYAFSSDRVEAAVAIHPALVDAENFYQLYAAFDFESDKEEVRQKLGL